MNEINVIIRARIHRVLVCVWPLFSRCPITKRPIETAFCAHAECACGRRMERAHRAIELCLV